MLLEYTMQASSLAVGIWKVSEGIRGEFASNTTAACPSDTAAWFGSGATVTWFVDGSILLEGRTGEMGSVKNRTWSFGAGVRFIVGVDDSDAGSRD